MTTINTSSMYRGLGTNVSALNNDPKQILEASGLNWRVGQAPMLMQGSREVRPVPGYKVNVRSDNGGVLSVSTDSYHPHHNSQLVGMMADFAKAGGLQLSHVGQFAGGTRIWAVAKSDAVKTKAEAVVGDIIQFELLLRSGHEPNVATTIRSAARRLVCMNGMTMSAGGTRTRVTHSTDLTQLRIETAGEVVMRGLAQFDDLMGRLRAMYRTPATAAVNAVYLMQLMQPELMSMVYSAFRPATAGSPASSTPEQSGVANAILLNRIMDQEESRSRYIVQDLIHDHGSRTLKAAIEAQFRQTGGQLSRGTLAHSYNGVTYFNSNVRGRSAETGLEADLFGAAMINSSAALEQAVEYTQLLSTR